MKSIYFKMSRNSSAIATVSPEPVPPTDEFINETEEMLS